MKFHCIVKNYVSNSATGDELKLKGTLISGGYINDQFSFAEAISSHGGPEVLMPILQAASTPQQICMFVKLLQACLTSSSNLKYLHRLGYRLIATLMTLKPISILTKEVLEAFFEITVHRNHELRP